jgi:hypothetical protein
MPPRDRSWQFPGWDSRRALLARFLHIFALFDKVASTSRLTPG